MGIIWYFEILAFFIDDDADHKWLYLGDVLNMLQVIHTILLWQPILNTFIIPGCLGLLDICL